MKQGTIEERARSVETKICINIIKIIKIINYYYSIQETLREEQSKVNDLEQYDKRNMVEINNMPFTTDENLESTITDVARKGMKLDHFNYK